MFEGLKFHTMRNYMVIVLLGLLLAACNTPTKDKKDTFITLFEESGGAKTPAYEEVIEFYKKLALSYLEVNFQTMDETDSGLPLHIVSFNTDGEFNFQKLHEEKTIILINNGIHPGETDGIDATMMLFRDLAQGKIKPPKNTVIIAIPIYNIGGALERNSTTRVNQNGPEEYGFRGNARNYDLNRDFIKSDTKNALAFAAIFHLLKPDIFIDTHVSDGADYSYTLTHIFTQHNKLGGTLGEYVDGEFVPKLKASLAQEGWDSTPYVNVFNESPEAGFNGFIDPPRYSTGYTALWNTVGVMLENHMLKPYKKRVEGAYQFLKTMIVLAEAEGKKIRTLREQNFETFTQSKTYPLQWMLDTTRSRPLLFKGYEATYTPSEVTGMPRLKYDQNKPFEKEITYHPYYLPSLEVKIPEAYIIPKGWWRVVQLLEANHVEMLSMEKDSMVHAEVYTIEDYKTSSSAYEGHYPHTQTQVSVKTERILVKKGDIWVKTRQPALRYLMETLEPQGADSFFNWNFFDTILQQKEGFSPYLFEDIATTMLASDSVLKTAFQTKKQTDRAFSQNSYAQLDWLYQRSIHREKAYQRYPIYRVPAAQ